MKKIILSMLFFIVLLGCSRTELPAGTPAAAEPNVDGPAVTRSQAVLTADKYARVHWTLKEQNRVACGGNFVSRYSVGKRIGMAYKWSGWDDIETFLRKVKEGHGAGTGGGTGVYNHFSVDCVVGTSCTGLVSRAWHLNRKYTLNYNDPRIKCRFFEITHDIEGASLRKHQSGKLKKGDAFINRTHIVLYLYETRDGIPMIIDSRAPGVRFRAETWERLRYQGYKAIRYNNIKDTAKPMGTIELPISIYSRDFPYTAAGNTRNVVSMEFDSYSTAPGSNEQGPEVLYRLQLDKTGIIKIDVTDIKHEGIDNNVYLLASLKKGDDFAAVDCIAGNDNSITRKLKPGTYYISVDSGNDKPGEYKVSVDFLKE